MGFASQDHLRSCKSDFQPTDDKSATRMHLQHKNSSWPYKNSDLNLRCLKHLNLTTFFALEVVKFKSFF